MSVFTLFAFHNPTTSHSLLLQQFSQPAPPLTIHDPDPGHPVALIGVLDRLRCAAGVEDLTQLTAVRVPLLQAREAYGGRVTGTHFVTVCRASGGRARADLSSGRRKLGSCSGALPSESSRAEGTNA